MAKLAAVTALAATAATGSMAVPSAHAATTHASISASTRHVQAAAATATFSLDDTDPIDTGCWDANASVVAGPLPIHDYYGNLLGYVRNWYSPDCGTNWSEVYTADGSYQTLWVTVERPSDRYRTPPFILSGNDAYSNQVYAPDTTACAEGTINGASPDGFQQACA